MVYRLFEDLEKILDFHFGPKFQAVQTAKAQITQVGKYELKKRKGGVRTVVGLEVKQGTAHTQHTYSLVSKPVLMRLITQFRILIAAVSISCADVQGKSSFVLPCIYIYMHVLLALTRPHCICAHVVWVFL